MPLADLGRRAWPRDPGQVCREDFAELAGLRGLLVDLGWRMVDFVAVQVQGRAAFQISVPLLDPLPGFESLSCPTWAAAATGAWCPGPSQPLMAFVLCVWAMYKATCPPTQATSYAMMSVHHKASVAEGGDEGVAWLSLIHI